MLIKKSVSILSVCAILFAFGCSDDDGTVTADQGVQQDAQVVNCDNGDCKEYIISRLLLPTTVEEANAYGYDYNDVGTPNNALGGLLAGIVTFLGGSFELQPTIDLVLYVGNAPIMLQLQTTTLADAAINAESYIGQVQECCPGNETNLEQCKADGLVENGCFSGDAEFSVDPAASVSSLSGNIASGKVELGPAALNIKLPLIGEEVLDITLKEARIKGDATDGAVTNGIISGLIEKEELDTKILPAVANMLQSAIDDPTTPADSKAQIIELFDPNEDGTIELSEVQSNTFITTFLSGDVDVDNDGKKELSIGLGFEAVKVKIKK